MAPSRLWFALGQIGATVTKGALDPRNLLLDVQDLPGTEWRQLDQRLWRAGRANDMDWARSARASNSVTGWWSFEQRRAQRWIWTQATPLPNPGDAYRALADAPRRLLANLRSDVTVVEECEPEPPANGGASHVRAKEQRTAGPRGHGQALYLAWTVDNVFSAAAWSADEDSWTWRLVAELATVQANRIAIALRGGMDSYPNGKID
jgi:hypothetical protein